MIFVGGAAALLVIAACADGTLPARGLNDPANPQAREAPATRSTPVGPSPAASSGADMNGMPGMDHSSMPGMDHSKMPGMDHSNMQMPMPAPSGSSGVKP